MVVTGQLECVIAGAATFIFGWVNIACHCIFDVNDNLGAHPVANGWPVKDESLPK
jgi:hypothetical protein